ncbi:MAG TPA: ADP-glyceromanno-heptose 6-epimerase, partial [Chitinophagaceae bacterium]|nr:ADP-glyceromanno-heptose 6-epimerase [Chitinophagaceae bacterium]
MSNLNTQSSIIITGAAGFIGSCMIQFLNEKGFDNLILVDDFGVEEKRKNWEGKKFTHLIERYNLFDWLEANTPKVDFFLHIGARTDTTEFNYEIHHELNYEYSKKVWHYCTASRVPLIYASSAATYGAGELGYNDDHDVIEKLHPLNPYGVSKNEFDKLALLQINQPPFWAGLKYFNVYGPNEGHKHRMASVIFHSFNQIMKDGVVRLFKSHRPEFADGEQLRDFVYVKDVLKVMYWMMQKAGNEGRMTVESKDASGAGVICHLEPGIYNLGTGKARTFNDLVKATYAAIYKEPFIVYSDMPEDIRDKYQYFTEANMQKLHNAGYEEPFYSLEDGVMDYVGNYLAKGKIW